jgi:hypothetical protein
VSESADPAGQTDQPSSDRQRIIRRQPENSVPSAPQPAAYEPKTSIIRRHPTGGLPASTDEPLARRADSSDEPLARRADSTDEPQTSLIDPQTTYIEQPAADDIKTGYIPRARPREIPPTAAGANPKTAVAAAVLSIFSGWATAVIATDLITGWWRTDRLFCVAIGFLTAISAAATIGGLILLLLRRRMGRLLIVVGAIIGLLIFASLFVAGARVPSIVYAIPVLPLASIVLTLLPSTRRWARWQPTEVPGC